VDVPKDITADIAEFAYPKTIEMRSYTPVLKGHSGQNQKSGEVITRS